MNTKTYPLLLFCHLIYLFSFYLLQPAPKPERKKRRKKDNDIVSHLDHNVKKTTLAIIREKKQQQQINKNIPVNVKGKRAREP